MPVVGKSPDPIFLVGDYYVPPPTKNLVRHCVDCLTNPVVEVEPPDGNWEKQPRKQRCTICEFKRDRRINGAHKAEWQGSYWPDEGSYD
jgi:hypothetical protein